MHLCLANRRCLHTEISDRNLVGYLISSGKVDEAISKCASVLDELGEPLSPNIMEVTLGPVLREYILVVARVRHNTSSLPYDCHRRLKPLVSSVFRWDLSLSKISWLSQL